MLTHFLAMGGYGFYVWLSYGSVVVFLGTQWFFTWKRWSRFRHSIHRHE